jgi:hypothetical protein
VTDQNNELGVDPEALWQTAEFKQEQAENGGDQA